MSNRMCSIDECDKPVYGRGWCRVHWQHWYRHGDPLYVRHIVGDAVARFWSYVNRDGAGGCWLWTGHHVRTGYGTVIGHDGKRGVAHRFAYELLVGPVPAGFELDHLCRVRDCVNPAHLEPVTAAENNRRMRTALGPLAQCKRGHLFTDENTYEWNGHRACRICKRAASAKESERRKALRAARRATT